MISVVIHIYTHSIDTRCRPCVEFVNVLPRLWVGGGLAILGVSISMAALLCNGFATGKPRYIAPSLSMGIGRSARRGVLNYNLFQVPKADLARVGSPSGRKNGAPCLPSPPPPAAFQPPLKPKITEEGRKIRK